MQGTGLGAYTFTTFHVRGGEGKYSDDRKGNWQPDEKELITPNQETYVKNAKHWSPYRIRLNNIEYNLNTNKISVWSWKEGQ